MALAVRLREDYDARHLRALVGHGTPVGDGRKPAANDIAIHVFSRWPRLCAN
jgi:hypothetical protein